MTKAKQYIQDYTRNCSNEIITFKDDKPFADTLYHPWLTPDQALSAVEIARDEAIENVISVLKVVDYKDYISSITSGVGIISFDADRFVSDIKKTFNLSDYGRRSHT